MPQPIKYPELSAVLESVRCRKSALRGKKYSLRSLSQATAVDYGHIHRVFHGQSHPSREILLKICKALDCSQEEAMEIFGKTEYRGLAPDEI